MPKHKAAMAEIKELVQQVEEQKQQYIEVDIYICTGKKNTYKTAVYIKVTKNISIEVIHYFTQVKHAYKEQYIEEKLYP